MIKKILKYFMYKNGIQVQRLRTKSDNPNKLISVKVGKFNILSNESHLLPVYLKEFPHYSLNFPRLASKVKSKYDNLTMIDIGANIGDTVALTRSESYFPIVCIEGDPRYFNILEKNIKQFNDVQAFQYFLGEQDEIIVGKSESDQGTLKIVPSLNPHQKDTIPILSLDNFLKLNPDFKTAKLLKIDTDGFDLMILRGGVNYISQTKPILFFEYDRGLLKDLKDDGLTTLNLLETMGYETAIFYDNFGRLIASADLKNKRLIEQLHFYIENYKGAFRYYDICLFHQIDRKLAEGFIEEEMHFFVNN